MNVCRFYLPFKFIPQSFQQNKNSSGKERPNLLPTQPNSLNNKMDNSCLAVRGINHIYIAVERKKGFQNMKEKNQLANIRTEFHASSSKTPKKVFQYLICAVILKFLYHGLRILYRHDERVKNDLDRIDSGTVINLSCSAHGPSLKMISAQNGIDSCRREDILPDIDIRFKDSLLLLRRIYRAARNRRILFKAYDVR